NHAFYLAAIAIGGNTWPVLGRIWYETLTKRLEPEDGFQQFANATTEVAGNLFGFGGSVQASVASAWAAVGLATPAELTARLPIKGLPAAGAGPVKRVPKWRRHPVC